MKIKNRMFLSMNAKRIKLIKFSGDFILEVTEFLMAFLLIPWAQ